MYVSSRPEQAAYFGMMLSATFTTRCFTTAAHVSGALKDARSFSEQRAVATEGAATQARDVGVLHGYGGLLLNPASVCLRVESAPKLRLRVMTSARRRRSHALELRSVRLSKQLFLSIAFQAIQAE